MKKHKITKPENQKPVIVAIPNTTREKMTAIANLAAACERLANALCSVNTSVNIERCDFSGPGPGIEIKGDV